MRINRYVLGALKKAARKERRTVASLMDKIILDYLEKEGLLLEPELGEERRRFQRMMVAIPANSTLIADSKVDTLPSVILNISLGGVLIACPKAPGIRISSLNEMSDFELSFTLPVTNEQLNFLCDARRVNDASKDIKVGAIFKNPDEEDLRKLQSYLM